MRPYRKIGSFALSAFYSIAHVTQRTKRERQQLRCFFLASLVHPARVPSRIGDPAETRDRETRARIAHRFQCSDRGAIFSVHNYAAVCREMSVKLSNRARLSTSRSLNGNSADLFTRARVLFLANERAELSSGCAK
jgi:hypothetical protein